MEGDLDPFDFVLAQDLGMTIGALRAMGNDEYLAWRAFYTWRKAMTDLARQS